MKQKLIKVNGILLHAQELSSVAGVRRDDILHRPSVRGYGQVHTSEGTCTFTKVLSGNSRRTAWSLSSGSEDIIRRVEILDEKLLLLLKARKRAQYSPHTIDVSP